MKPVLRFMELIKLGFSLADADLVRVTKEGSSLSLELRLWNDVLKSVFFSEVLAFQDLGASGVSGLARITSSAFGERVVSRCFENPLESSVQIFALLDVNDEPFFEVVTEADGKLEFS